MILREGNYFLEAGGSCSLRGEALSGWMGMNHLLGQEWDKIRMKTKKDFDNLA
jgi:hypothetical protein